MSITLLEQAKAGDAAAIAALMNQALQPQGISVRCDRQDDCLQLWLTGDRLPPQTAIVDYVRRGIDRLQTEGVNALQIYADQAEHQEPGWGVEVALNTVTAEVKPLPRGNTPLPEPEPPVAEAAPGDCAESSAPSAAPGTPAYAYALLGLAPDDSLQKVEGTYFKLKALALREGDRAKVEDLKQAFYQLKEYIEHPPAKAEAAPAAGPSPTACQDDQLSPVEQIEARLKRRGIAAKVEVQDSQLHISWLAVRVINPEDAAGEVRALLTHQNLAAMGLDAVKALVISGLNRDRAVVWQQTFPLAKR
ncbi:hypothetical protein [Nodosilinea nodulosa]|uniref:hypothetical protein n=1 Tax=Nodosilinea nodulosa TaxID=416001 RepID=UPI0002F10CE9|nr:hypothetical protein [Nodosilinea nodulosa]